MVSYGKLVYGYVLNSHKMLNSAWNLIKLTRLNNKCLIFRKKYFCPKKTFQELYTTKMSKLRVKNLFFVFCFNIALLTNNVTLNMTLLIENHLFDTKI